MTPGEWIALGALCGTLLWHSMMLFRWSGRLEQVLKDHERRITKLEET